MEISRLCLSQITSQEEGRGQIDTNKSSKNEQTPPVTDAWIHGFPSKQNFNSQV